MTTKIPLYQKLARAISARNEGSGNLADIDTLLSSLDSFLQALDCEWMELKNGVIIQHRCTVDQDQYKNLIIRSSFYKNGNPIVPCCFGGKDEIDFVVTVKPSLVCGIELAITGKFGRERYWLEDYLYEIFHYALTQTI